MTTVIENDGTTPVRIRNSTLDKITKIMKGNSIFQSPAAVVEFAVNKLMEKGDGK